MSYTLQEFRDEVREHCGVSESEWDNATVDKLLNRSFWETQDLFDFREEEETADIAVVAGTSSYAIEADQDSVESVRILDTNTDEWIPLGFEDYERFSGLLSDSTNSRRRPEYYTRRGNQIVFRNTPDASYTVRVYYRKSLGDVLSSGTGLPQAWDEVVMYGGVWRGFAKLGDWNRKQHAKATQAELVQPKKPTKVKELEDTRMAGLAVVRRPYR
jgi:hypothetical protein